ncbi:site-specific integrase [Pseudomonas sp. TNT3]|uniref:tyrosine-type recombinase/integrase n=1 Tax=Pseudomonas sp. TNT3 TaxID=2654097 RepID=UPI0013919C34|nr:site-specific integrase [Pseudomonas sp. TNT3]KAI2693096.1 tyrosine-type recombinase/integrase [Pseudomonas sp. TNT3]
MANITDRQMSAKPGSSDRWLSETIIWGHGSLVARITPSGERLFYFRYVDSQGKRATYPIGSYSRDGDSMMTLADARKRTAELATLHKNGTRDIREYLEAEQSAAIAARNAELARLENERAQAEAASAALAARQTVTAVFERWMKIDIANRKDGGAEVRRMFEKDVLPFIGNRFVADVKKGHITEVTDTMLSRGVNRAAKIAFSLMRQMFRFAVDRDLIEHDPTASIRKAKIGQRDTERDRVLSADEIKLLAKNIQDAGLLITTEAAIWIALSTCCRIGELLSARWEDINLEAKTWMIPSQNSKNNKPHLIFLSAFAVRQFERVNTISNKSIWCYPNTDNSGPVSSKTVTKQLGDRQRQPDQGVMSRRSAKPHALLLTGGKWTPHDLRRTGATIMTALGVLPEVAERCLNHTEEKKVKRIYQRHNYAKEMTEAWSLLGQHLEVITNLASDISTP